MPRSNPFTTPPDPIVTGRGCHAWQLDMNAFAYVALSVETDCRLVSNTSPVSENVPMQSTCTWAPLSERSGGVPNFGTTYPSYTPRIAITRMITPVSDPSVL